MTKPENQNQPEQLSKNMKMVIAIVVMINILFFAWYFLGGAKEPSSPQVNNPVQQVDQAQSSGSSVTEEETPQDMSVPPAPVTTSPHDELFEKLMQRYEQLKREGKT